MVTVKTHLTLLGPVHVVDLSNHPVLFFALHREPLVSQGNENSLVPPSTTALFSDKNTTRTKIVLSFP